MSENIFIKNALKKALELLNNNSLNEAAEQLNTILQKDSQNIEALTLLIQISIKQSNPREALKINKLLLSVLPENKEYLEQIVKIYKSNRPVKTASSEQVRQPIYKSGLHYWKNYTDNLTILTNHFLDTNE
jgi:cytochrome c-type biogenesis protein CcmH/NrfG